MYILMHMHTHISDPIFQKGYKVGIHFFGLGAKNLRQPETTDYEKTVKSSSVVTFLHVTFISGSDSII